MKSPARTRAPMLLIASLLLAGCGTPALAFSPTQLDCGDTDNLAIDVSLPGEAGNDWKLVMVEDNGTESFFELRPGRMEKLEDGRYRLLIDDLSGCRPGTYHVEVRDSSGNVKQSADLKAIDSR